MFGNRENMVYEFYIEESMQMVIYKLKTLIENIPHLINALGRSVNHFELENTLTFQITNTTYLQILQRTIFLSIL